MRANEFANELIEARRNNFGREISNVQGQALGKKLAAGDPNAQAALGQAKAAQATNQTDNTGGVLGKTTPQQRLAAQQAQTASQQSYPVANVKATPLATQQKQATPLAIQQKQTAQATPQQRLAAKRAQAQGPAIDADEVRPRATPAAGNTAAAAATASPAVAGTDDSEKYDPIQSAKNLGGKLSSAGSGFMQGLDRFKQSDVGQKLGGWSQRLVGVGDVTAGGKQIWMGKFLQMVNNLIATERNSGIPYDFGQEMQKYIKKQNINVPQNQMTAVIKYAKSIQANGYKRPDILKLANTMWAIGMNASAAKNQYKPAGAGATDNAAATTAPTAPTEKTTGTSLATQPAQSNANPDATASTTANQQTGLATQQQYGNVNQGPVRWHTSQQLGGPENKAGQIGMNDPNVIDVDAREVPDRKQIGMNPRQLGFNKPATKQPTGTTPVGTKFALKVRGQLVKAEKTADGWKVQGKLINDPKQAAVLDKQAKLATQNKGRPVNRANPAKQPAASVQPNRPAKPVRKLKAPSALAKGKPGKPSSAGKSRIR